MSDVQIFQFLGITFLAIGVGMLTNRNFIKDILQEFAQSTTNVFYGGLMSLSIGFLLVTFHNIWSVDRYLIITILGWMALIKGLALLAFPAPSIRFYKNVKTLTPYVGYCIIAFGSVLLYMGYMA